MTTLSQISLEEFLRMPGIEEPPGLEYIDGHIERNMLSQFNHVLIQTKLGSILDRFSEAESLGESFTELRCTFAGRSILPDGSFLVNERIPLDESAEICDEITIPPDIHVEIISPDRGVGKSREKLRHSTLNGCSLGILIHPGRKVIEIYRPGVESEILPLEGAIDFAPVLPGKILAVSDVFGWLTPRIRRPGAEPA